MGAICDISGGIDQFKNYGGDLKFVFKFKLMIHEIGGHTLAEGSRISVPAPRRVQIFLQVCPEVPKGVTQKKYKMAYILSPMHFLVKIKALL